MTMVPLYRIAFRAGVKAIRYSGNMVMVYVVFCLSSGKENTDYHKLSHFSKKRPDLQGVSDFTVAQWLRASNIFRQLC